MPGSSVFWWAVLGGIAGQFLPLFGHRDNPDHKVPHQLSWWYWWVMSVLMVAAGGVLAHLYESSGQHLTPIVAFNVGASAPLALGALIAATPTLTGPTS